MNEHIAYSVSEKTSATQTLFVVFESTVFEVLEEKGYTSCFVNDNFSIILLKDLDRKELTSNRLMLGSQLAGTLVRFSDISDSIYHSFREAIVAFGKQFTFPNRSYRTAKGRACLVPPIRYTTEDIKTVKKVALKLRISKKAYQRLRHSCITLKRVLFRANSVGQTIVWPEGLDRKNCFDIFISGAGTHDIGTYSPHEVAEIVEALELWKSSLTQDSENDGDEEWIVI